MRDSINQWESTKQDKEEDSIEDYAKRTLYGVNKLGYYDLMITLSTVLTVIYLFLRVFAESASWLISKTKSIAFIGDSFCHLDCLLEDSTFPSS